MLRLAIFDISCAMEGDDAIDWLYAYLRFSDELSKQQRGSEKRDASVPLIHKALILYPLYCESIFEHI